SPSAWSTFRPVNSPTACARSPSGSRCRWRRPLMSNNAETDPARDALITGIGIVSCLGEGPGAHWAALGTGEFKADATAYPPYFIHRIVPLDFDKQIPKKGDQRQMEAWQRIGTYAAGLALDSAGI